MFIYIDESGTFAMPARPKHAYSCVGALTIPERHHGTALKSFKTLKRRWGKLGLEIKGKELIENQVAEVVSMLIRCGARFHVCVTDMLHNEFETVKAFKLDQASHLLADLTPQHQPSFIKQLNEISEQMRTMPNQLFMQLCLMTDLVNRQLRDAIISFALTDPPELGAFRWVIDRKARDETSFEYMWRNLICPFIQSRQLLADIDHRIVEVSGRDYSHFEKFCTRLEAWPDHLPPRPSGIQDGGDIPIIQLNKIMWDSFAFRDSAETPGLQLVDIVTNAFRRAITGNLQLQGWRDIGKLMFRWKNEAVQVVRLGKSGDGDTPIEDVRCAKVIMAMTALAQSVV